jgi:hypothetical protein
LVPIWKVTVTLVVLGKNFPQLSFLNTLLGSESTIPPKMQFYHRLRYLFALAELRHKRTQEICELECLPMGTVSAVQLQDVLHHPIQPLSVVVNDGQESPLRFVELQFLQQQLRGVVDGGQGVSDFMCDVGGQPTHGCQLHLLRFGLDARQILQKYHHTDAATAPYGYEARTRQLGQHGPKRVRAGTDPPANAAGAQPGLAHTPSAEVRART